MGEVTNRKKSWLGIEYYKISFGLDDIFELGG